MSETTPGEKPVKIPAEKPYRETNVDKVKEIGGQQGPDPTRYGDWEKNGRVSDF